MVQITTSTGRQIKIDWRHSHASGVTDDRGSATECFIADDGAFVIVRKAVVGKRDRFCRRTGRKLSLQRALVAALPTREERRSVWQHPEIVRLTRAQVEA